MSVINESTLIADDVVRSYSGAFEKQWNRHLARFWPILPARFEFVDKRRTPKPLSWWLVFLDDSDQADDLAYHDLTNRGEPISKVFVRTLRDDKASVSVGATHELCEMAVDPWLNNAYQDPKNAFWAGEVCDPVEDDRYGYLIDGVLVTDFVTPRWFAYEHAEGAYDYAGHVRSAFEILKGGYAQRWGKAGWRQRNGPETRPSKSAPAPVGSRRDRRKRGRSKWRNSRVRFGKMR